MELSLSDGENKTAPLWRGCFVESALGAAHVGSVRSFFALSDFESDGVTFIQVVKRDADQVLRVEEQILRLALARDESESTRSLCFDCSGHVCLLIGIVASIGEIDRFLVCKYVKYIPILLLCQAQAVRAPLCKIRMGRPAPCRRPITVQDPYSKAQEKLTLSGLSILPN